MTTITTPPLELAPVGHEAAPSKLLFSLVDNMETEKIKHYEHTQRSLFFPFEGVDGGKTDGQRPANNGF